MQYHAKKSDTPAAKAAEATKVLELSAVIVTAQEGGYVSYNLETGSGSQGDTKEEAFANLRDATELYLEDFPLPENFKSRAILKTMKISVKPPPNVE